jgi:hypothetical protein
MDWEYFASDYQAPDDDTGREVLRDDNASE